MFFTYIWGYAKGEAKAMLQSQKGMGGVPSRGGAPPILIWASWPLSCVSKALGPFVLVKNFRGIFFSILFPVKIDRKILLLKTTSDSAVLPKYGEILE
jgi:hypothetical protein